MAPSITKAPVKPLVVPSRKNVIKSHVLYQGVVAKVIEGLDLIDDCELVNLPQGVIPPFPFIQIFPTKNEWERGLHGWHFNVCHSGSTSKQSCTFT